MKKLIAITFGLLSVITTASAQHWCGTMEDRKEINADNPKVAEEIEKRFEAFNRLQRENSEKGIKNTDNYIVPVVFHVIHRGGEENISLDQIKDQMRILNEDFAYLNPDTTDTPEPFKAYAGNTNIEFRLAQIDPDGNCTQGVTRTYSLLTSSANNNVKEIIQWDPHKYLNVWVVKDIDKESSYGTILGYAQFPDQLWDNAETDGIVLLDSYCGSIGTASSQKGRTLTHEVGHWLNLRHIWGDETCGNDHVNDTPIAFEPNFGVCLNDFPHHTDTAEFCTADTLTQVITQEYGEMFMNYMDYSDDHCMNMFSLGQGERMRSAILEYRPELVSEDNLVATGTNDDYVTVLCAPIPEFSSDFIYGCPGDAYSFQNETYNIDFDLDPDVTYTWSFEGGSPSTAGVENPTNIVYNNPGFYTVTLTASNAAGERIATKEGYITVTNDEDNRPMPYIQNFESSQFPTYPNDSWNWLISDLTDPTWSRTTDASSPNITGIDNVENNASVRIRSAEFTREGDIHSLITPTIDLTNASNPVKAYFEIAYAQKNITSDDMLKIYVSDDCGRTWLAKKTYFTEGLITNDSTFVFLPFVPNEDEWKQFDMSLNPFIGEKNIQIKFEFSGQNGNWLYIDNFIVANSAEFSLNENNLTDLSIYPNPSKGDVTIEFDLYKKTSIQIALVNLYGATLAVENMTLDATKNRVQLSEIYSNLKAGIYFIQLNQNGNKITKKVVITD